MVHTSLRPLSVGEILDVSFSLYRRHFATLGTIAVLCSGIPVLLSLYIESSGGVLYNLPLTLLHYVIFTVLSSRATSAGRYRRGKRSGGPRRSWRGSSSARCSSRSSWGSASSSSSFPGSS